MEYSIASIINVLYRDLIYQDDTNGRRENSRFHLDVLVHVYEGKKHKPYRGLLYV
jgi:hypothetical protein